MIFVVMYFLFLAFSTYLFYLTGIININVYDIKSLFFIYNSINLKMLLSFIVVYGITLSLFYYIRKRKNIHIQWISFFFSLFPFILLSFFIFKITWFVVFLLTSILLSYLVLRRNYDEEVIYKIVPYEKLTIKLFKQYFTYSFLLLSAFVGISSFLYHSNSQYVNNFVSSISQMNLNFTDIDSLQKNIVNTQELSALMLSNNTITLVENEIYMSSIPYSNKVSCLKVIENNRQLILSKIKQSLSFNTSQNNNTGIFNKMQSMILTIIRLYPLIISTYIYLMLDFFFILFTIILEILINLYKFVLNK